MFALFAFRAIFKRHITLQGVYNLSKRHNIFFTLSALIFSVLLLRMLFLAGSGGADYRRTAGNISVKNGSLSAIRGRIFDKNNNLLVWSERCYDLQLNELPQDARRLKIFAENLRNLFGYQLDMSEQHNAVMPLIIKYNLTADELAGADELAARYSEFEVVLRWERRCAAPVPELGEVRQINGMEHGVSGWEKEFDHILKGTPGTFTVMLDRHGRWVNSTFRIINPAAGGGDVYLSEQAAEEENE